MMQNIDLKNIKKEDFTPEVRKKIFWGAILVMILIYGLVTAYKVFFVRELDGTVMYVGTLKIDVQLSNGDRIYFDNGNDYEWKAGDACTVPVDGDDHLSLLNFLPCAIIMFGLLAFGISIIIYLYQILIYSKYNYQDTIEIIIEALES